MRYSTQTQSVLQASAQLARTMGHGYVGSAHLLIALSQGTDAVAATLRNAGIDPKLTGQMARLLYGSGTPGLPLPQGFSEQMRRILRGAGREAGFQSSSKVEPIHLLLSLLRQEKTAARELLALGGVEAERLFDHVVATHRWTPEKKMPNVKEAAKTKLLEQFSEDLVLKALNMECIQSYVI